MKSGCDEDYPGTEEEPKTASLEENENSEISTSSPPWSNVAVTAGAAAAADVPIGAGLVSSAGNIATAESNILSGLSGLLGLGESVLQGAD